MSAPICAFPGCDNIRASKGKRGANSPVTGDTRRRYSWCNYHRKGGGKADRMELMSRSKANAEA